MLPFFRKIRKKLLKENNFSRYTIYAVGEIILIVIGILIALGINNWNQTRQDSRKEQFYLDGLKTEFEASHTKLTTLIEVNRMNFENSKQIAVFITDENSTISETELSKLLYNAFSFEIAYNPNNSLLNELINSGKLESISSAELRKHLTSWASIIQSTHNQEMTLRKQRERTLDIFREGKGSIKTILDDSGITEETGLSKRKVYKSNLEIIRSTEFENNLLMFILTGISTETEHYQPLLEEIDTILELIKKVQSK